LAALEPIYISALNMADDTTTNDSPTLVTLSAEAMQQVIEMVDGLDVADGANVTDDVEAGGDGSNDGGDGRNDGGDGRNDGDDSNDSDGSNDSDDVKETNAKRPRGRPVSHASGNVPRSRVGKGDRRRAVRRRAEKQKVIERTLSMIDDYVDAFERRLDAEDEEDHSDKLEIFTEDSVLEPVVSELSDPVGDTMRKIEELNDEYTRIRDVAARVKSGVTKSDSVDSTTNDDAIVADSTTNDAVIVADSMVDEAIAADSAVGNDEIATDSTTNSANNA
jgi:hypothetical protein